MDFKKIYKRGLGFSFLLLIFIIGVLFIPNLNKKQVFDGNSIFTSAQEDNYEPNNDFTTAYDLTSHENVWLSSINGNGTQGDDDYFMIWVDYESLYLKIDLTFFHSLGDINLALYDNTWIMIAESNSTTDNEYIDIPNPIDGTYFLKVFGQNLNNSYDLLWQTDDYYEENDDYWSSSWIDPNYYYSNLKIVGSDDDWFRTYLNPGDIIDITIYFDYMANDLDLELYDPVDSINPRVKSYSVNNDEFISFTADISGDWRFKINRTSEDSVVRYDLDLLLNTGGPGDDYMEENDDFYSSKWVDPNSYSSLKLVYDDDDWFHTYLNPGDNIDVNIYFNHMEGDLQLELYDPTYTHRAGSYSVNDGEFIPYNADMAGDWRIRVYHAFGNSEVHYDLQISLNAGGPGDDGMEENDGFWSSWWVNPNWYSGLKLVKDDEDWFHTYLNPGDIIEVSIYFENKQGNLELELYDPFEDHRIGSYSGDDGESLRYMADVSGDWRIRVYHKFEDTEVSYDLDIWLLEDFYEFNDDPHMKYKDHPSNLIQFERTWLSDLYGMAVQGSPDWYVIEVSPGFEHLKVELTFNHTQGDIDMRIHYIQLDDYNNYQNHVLLNESSSSSDNETIDMKNIVSGYYFIEIYGPGWRNEYDMWWDDLKTDIRSDDYYETNNGPSSAYNISYIPEISLWEFNGLALQFDEDWYEIYVNDSNLELTVWLAYDSAEGLMGFEVYDGNLNKITGNFTLTDNDYIVHDVSKGTYYIRVFGDNSGNVYNLWWGTQEPEEIEMIPGYDLLILVVSIIGVSMVGIKIKRSKLKHK